MPNEPVRVREFNLWRQPWEDRIRQLEQRLNAHEAEHEQDERDQAVEAREHRRWSWKEIVVAAITAGGVITAAALSASGH